MAVVHVTLLAGRSQTVKDDIHRGITDVLVQALRTEPTKIRVILHEVAGGDYSVGGRAVGLPPDLRPQG
jgi:4-oxalocrotonate tautomerase family enzyme